MFQSLDHVRFRRGVRQVRQQEPAEPIVNALVQAKAQADLDPLDQPGSQVVRRYDV